MHSQYGELRPTNGREWFVGLGQPSKFQRVLHVGFITAATTLTGGQPNFARFLAVSLAGTLYTCSGLLPPDGILPGAKFTLQIMELSQTGATCIWQGSHHVGDRPTF